MTRTTDAERRRTFHVLFTDHDGKLAVRDFADHEADSAIFFAERLPDGEIEIRQDGLAVGQMVRTGTAGSWHIRPVAQADSDPVSRTGS